MKKVEHQSTEELLSELGYAEKDYTKEGEKMASFMKQTDSEIKREAQRYIDFLGNCEDNYYLKLKRGEINRIN